MNNRLYIFDIDGVLTDPTKKAFDNVGIIDWFNKQLKKNVPILLNTGRSISWVEEKIITRLDRKGLNNNFFVACEMGGVTAEFINNGSVVKIDEIDLAKLKKDIRELVINNYNEAMFLDESKKVVVTIEMNDCYSLEKYQIEQRKLIVDINNIVDNYQLRNEIEIGISTIAVDIKPRGYGKRMGMQKIVEWIKNKRPELLTREFVCVGDSISDIEMSQYCQEIQLNTRFVYVGTEKLDVQKYPFEIVRTKSKFVKGVVEYLVAFYVDVRTSLRPPPAA